MAPLLYYISASFQIHRWIQTRVTVRKRSIRLKIGDIFRPAWSWKFTDDPEKQQGTSYSLCQALCIISIHRWSQTCVTLRKRSIRVKNAWPWKLTDGIDKEQGTSSTLGQNLWIISLLYLNSNLSYSPETLNSGNNWRFFVLRDLQIWWMQLKNNRAPNL